MTEEQIDFVKAFNKLSEEEKAKFLETLSEEEKQVLLKLNEEYSK